MQGTVDEEKKAFKVRFEGSTYPNNEGTEQVRPVTVTGDELRIHNRRPRKAPLVRSSPTSFR
jgi:hypothetical protein